MPRPEKLTEEQEWFLSLLDLKFKEHEARMRGLLNLRPQDEHQLHLNELQLNPVDHDPSSNGNVLNEMDAIEAEKLADVEEDPEESKTPSKLTRSGSNRVTKFGSSYVMSEIDQPDPPIKSFVKGPLDLWMAMVVIINLTMMAAATQSTGHSADVALGLASGSTWGLTEQGFETAELIFYFIYVTDVLVRICILRSEWYFDNREGWMYMNFFDLLLVSVHTFEIVLLPVCLISDSVCLMRFGLNRKKTRYLPECTKSVKIPLRIHAWHIFYLYVYDYVPNKIQKTLVGFSEFEYIYI